MSYDDDEWEIVSKTQDFAMGAQTIMSAGVLAVYRYTIRNKETDALYEAIAEDEDDLGEQIAEGNITPLDDDD